MLFPLGIGLLGSLGLPLAVTFFVSRTPEAAPAIARMLRPVALIQVAGILLVHAGAIAAVTWGEPAEVKAAALTTLVVGPAMLFQQYGLAVLQGQGRFRAFNVLRLAPFVLYSIGSLGLFALNVRELEPFAAVWASTYVCAALSSVVVALKGLPARDVAGPSMSEMVGFGLKSVIGWASPVESFRIDQAVAGLFLSPAALGLYLAGLAFTNLPRFVAQSVGMVAYHKVASDADSATSRVTTLRFFWLNTAAAVAVVGALELTVGFLVPLFFGRAFEGGVPVARVLLVAALFLSMRRVLTDALRGEGRAAIGTLGEVLSWLLLVPLLGVLTPLFGIQGVGLSLLGSSLLSLLVVAAGARRGVPPWLSFNRRVAADTGGGLAARGLGEERDHAL
jgi:O-antigen/teichoic acid export membrane protein